MLCRNVHKNPKLQAAWNKYGEETFIFEVIEFVLVPFLVEREQYWIDKLLPFGKKGFNLAPVAGSSLGLKHSPQAIANNSAGQLGKKMSEETKRKMSESRKGKKRSPELREKMRVIALSRPPMSHEARDKIGKASASRTYSQETIEKRRISNFGNGMKTLVVTDPDGTEYTVRGLNAFCRDHGLTPSALGRVAQGKSKHHKGWRARYS
jgi:group I intron endonuclease